jgi:hypothetical protein
MFQSLSSSLMALSSIFMALRFRLNALAPRVVSQMWL